jgi:hypothetical protein
MEIGETLKLIISASVIIGVIYFAFNYINPGKPPTVDLNFIDHKSVKIDHITLPNVPKTIPIESKKSILEFVITELLQSNPVVIGGCSVLIAIFLIY